jgi:hypothetical protein
LLFIELIQPRAENESEAEDEAENEDKDDHEVENDENEDKQYQNRLSVALKQMMLKAKMLSIDFIS